MDGSGNQWVRGVMGWAGLEKEWVLQYIAGGGVRVLGAGVQEQICQHSPAKVFVPRCHVTENDLKSKSTYRYQRVE